MQAGVDKYGMVSVAAKRKQGNLANLRFVPLSKQNNGNHLTELLGLFV